MEKIWNTTFIILSPIIFSLRIIIYLKNSIFKKRRKIINESLKNQLSKNWKDKGGYVAGQGHYQNVWTRDSFFALMAPIPEKEYRLRTFTDRLKNDIKNGQIPFTYNEVYYIPKILFNKTIKRDKPIPKYKDEKYNSLVMDSNSQYIIMVHEAFKINNNKAWLRTHLATIKKAINWYNNYLENDLIKEKPFGSWEDTLLLNGNIAYTNILYLEALKRTHLIFITLKMKHYNYIYDNLYNEKYEKVINLIDKERDVVSVSLAALWIENEKINIWINYILNKKDNFMIKNRNPIKKNNDTMLAVRIIGQGNYHREWRWSWVGCLFCYILLKRNLINNSLNLFKFYKDAFNEYGTIYEVYNKKTKKPVEISLYKSEGMFSEGIGLYLLVEKLLVDFLMF